MMYTLTNNINLKFKERLILAKTFHANEGDEWMTEYG